METNNKPLYKVLNEKRTGGEWGMYISEKGKDGCSRAYINSSFPHDMYETICTMSGLNGNEAGENAKINAQYTALAVNNIAHLAEALEGLMNNPMPNPNMYNAADYFDRQSKYMEAKDKAREALKRIS